MGSPLFKSLRDKQLIKNLQNRAVGALPTDTVYGLVCRAADESAVARLYALKKREGKPGTVIAANVEQLVELGIPRRYVTAVAHFWPNPLSVVLPLGDKLSYLHLGLQSLAVRIPKPQDLQKLLVQTGPLLTTSANVTNQHPAANIKEAQAYFNGKVDFYVDGGDLSRHQPSTIVRMVDDAIDIVREGAVRIDENGRIS